MFAGEERLNVVRANLREPPSVMTVPLIILAGFSIVARYLGLPEFAFPNWIANWLEPVTASSSFAHLSLTFEWLLLGLSVVAAAVGLGLGYWVGW